MKEKHIGNGTWNKTSSVKGDQNSGNAWRCSETFEDTLRHSRMLEDTQKWKSGHDMRLERAKRKWYHNGKENILKFRNEIIRNRT